LLPVFITFQSLRLRRVGQKGCFHQTCRSAQRVPRGKQGAKICSLDSPIGDLRFFQQPG